MYAGLPASVATKMQMWPAEEQQARCWRAWSICTLERSPAMVLISGTRGEDDQKRCKGAVT